MFGLHKESLRLADVNPRKEIHGDEKVLAVDLKLEFETSNAVLLKFSPTLRDALYTQDPGATIDMIDPSHAPTLRNPQMGEIKWALEMPFVRFSVFVDGTNDEDIVFIAAKCNNFRFTCKEGGTVIVTCRVQKSEPLEVDVTKLLFLMDKQIKVSLEAEDEPEDYGDGEEGKAEFQQGEVDLLTSSQAGDEQSDTGPASETELADQYDALYTKAVTFVRDLNKVSISIVKRELKIDALVATRMLEQMEEEQIVGPAAGNGLRDVIAVTA